MSTINPLKVSVIITAYNALKYLPEALNSVLGQTYKNFEVLIVDDGSTDETSAWATHLNEPRVRYIAQQNQGVSTARNNGIQNAQGQYVAFLDGDDIWEPTKLEKQVQVLDQNLDICVVHTWLALMDERARLTGRVMRPKGDGDVWQQIVENNSVACSAAMVRRSCFKEVGFFDTTLKVAEDWDLWIRIARKYHFHVVPEALVRYRIHLNSKSKKYPEMLHNFRRIIENAFQDAPFELLYLRSRSYGRIHLCIAWKCLQNSGPNPDRAAYFCEQALQHYPKLAYSKEYVRLRAVIFIMKWFGLDSYKRILLLFNTMRRRVTESGSSPTS